MFNPGGVFLNLAALVTMLLIFFNAAQPAGWIALAVYIILTIWQAI